MYKEKVTDLSPYSHRRVTALCYDKDIRGGDAYGNIESRESD